MARDNDPGPGPISKTCEVEFSVSENSELSSMAREITLSSIKKCCPKDFWGLILSRKRSTSSRVSRSSRGDIYHTPVRSSKSSKRGICTESFISITYLSASNLTDSMEHFSSISVKVSQPIMPLA